MKKSMLLMASLLAFGVGGCFTPKKEPVKEDMLYEKLWETKTVHNEPCVMIEQNDGTKSARLFYKPSKIISVKNYTLEREYSPDEYYIDGDRIVMKENSTMPFLTQANVKCQDVPDIIKGGGTGTYDDGKGGYILFTEGIGIISYQVSVTYEHNETWKGKVPEKLGNLLPKLHSKLAKKEEIRLVINGDSIFTGANSSGKLGIEPFIDTFPVAFASEIKRVYGSNVILTNTSIGGQVSQWGRDNVMANVNQYHPDLAVIGFGMNDGSWNIPAYQYQENIEFMIKSIKANNPDCEIIIGATILANPNSSQAKGQESYLPYLQELQESYEGVVVLDMTTYSKEILSRKNSLEIYANNINHPNDFMVRGYVSNLMQLISK